MREIYLKPDGTWHLTREEVEWLNGAADRETALKAELTRLREENERLTLFNSQLTHDFNVMLRSEGEQKQRAEAAEEACSRQELELHTLRAKLAEAQSSDFSDVLYRATTAEAELAAAREQVRVLREALDSLVIVNGREIGFRTLHNIPMQMAMKIEKKVRAALRATEEKS